MAITQEVKIEMLEKLADGNFKIKYPKTTISQIKELTGIATQEEAKAGTGNTQVMTPLRVKEAMVASLTGELTIPYEEWAGQQTKTFTVPIGAAKKKGIIYASGARFSLYNVSTNVDGAWGVAQSTNYALSAVKRVAGSLNNMDAIFKDRDNVSIGVFRAYISGTNLVIEIKNRSNYAGYPENVDSKILWEVW